MKNRGRIIRYFFIKGLFRRIKVCPVTGIYYNFGIMIQKHENSLRIKTESV